MIHAPPVTLPNGTAILAEPMTCPRCKRQALIVRNVDGRTTCLSCVEVKP